MSGVDTEQQGDSEGEPNRPSESGHFFLVTGAWGSGGPDDADGPGEPGGPDDAGGPRPWRAVPTDGLTLGRAATDFAREVAFDDPKMSRTHARIERGPASWTLIDLNSRNGSFVDGSRVTPGVRAALLDGAVVRMGDTVLVFRAAAAPKQPASLAGVAGVAGVRTVSGATGVADAIGTAERGAFPGISAAAHTIRRRLAALATRSGHVLILGETGTGKERVARALAPRADAPFVVQNCAELTRDLARSELFGHLRGAFTGAHGNRTGLVEAATEGVLFLDEIGELPFEVQGELLRFLEDGTYRPLGSLELRKSRARIVAATNVDLDAAVRSGSFRRDLLARLRASNAPLELPPLRDRREDVAGWVRAFTVEVAAELSEALGSGAPRRELWTPGALECLLLYSWPENLRELRGLVRELFAGLTTGKNDEPIGAEALPERVRVRRASQRAHSPSAGSSGQPDIVQLMATGSVPGIASPPAGAAAPPAPPKAPAPMPTYEEVDRVMAALRGNMKAASEALSINRRAFYRLCEELGIDRERYRATAAQPRREE